MEDKLYGRGACDMKGFIACALTLLPTVVQQAAIRGLTNRFIWHCRMMKKWVVGCAITARGFKSPGIKPDYCIVGEPTMMKMVTAHKGIQCIAAACMVNQYIHRWPRKASMPSAMPAKLSILLIHFAEQLQQRNDQDMAFDVPFSTLSVGTITGGTATNIVPKPVRIHLWLP